MLSGVFFPAVGGLFVISMGDDEDTKGKSKSIARTVEMENLSLDISSSRFSRDLLQRFRGNSRDNEAGKGEAADEEVELNLGLSLGGRFGVDRSSNPLVRSSSIASCLPVTRDDRDAAAPATPAAPTALARTASMPVEAEEEWRKRKELQSLRRMEAKRRRSEKLRNLRIEKEGIGSGSGGLTTEDRKEIESNLRGRLDREKSLSALRRSARSQFRLSDWAAGIGSEPAGVDPPLAKGKASSGARGSVESKAWSSSSMSDLESRPMAGSSDEVSIQSMQESGSQEAAGSSSTKAREHTAGSDMESPSRDRGWEIQANTLEDMPCVFTKGDGPNGRRVDGILYKYGKGEEVRIMCVCHGTFHSPSDFILHAGGTDVNNPLRHIVVNPNSSTLL